MAAAVVLAALAAAAPAKAQEQQAGAVLLSGPIPVRGIPLYPPNRIPAFKAVYSLGGDPGVEKERRMLTVLFTRQDLFVPKEWVLRRCGARRLYQAPDHETFALCYRDERGYFLFLFFPETEEPADWCAFSDSFIERFTFLYNFVDSDTDVPFPAILQPGDATAPP